MDFTQYALENKTVLQEFCKSLADKANVPTGTSYTLEGWLNILHSLPESVRLPDDFDLRTFEQCTYPEQAVLEKKSVLTGIADELRRRMPEKFKRNLLTIEQFKFIIDSVFSADTLTLENPTITLVMYSYDDSRFDEFDGVDLEVIFNSNVVARSTVFVDVGRPEQTVSNYVSIDTTFDTYHDTEETGTLFGSVPAYISGNACASVRKTADGIYVNVDLSDITAEVPHTDWAIIGPDFDFRIYISSPLSGGYESVEALTFTGTI